MTQSPLSTHTKAGPQDLHKELAGYIQADFFPSHPKPQNSKQTNRASTRKDRKPKSKADPRVASPASPGLLSSYFQQLYYSENHVVCLFKKPSNYSEPLIFHIKTAFVCLAVSRPTKREGPSLEQASRGLSTQGLSRRTDNLSQEALAHAHSPSPLSSSG